MLVVLLNATLVIVFIPAGNALAHESPEYADLVNRGVNLLDKGHGQEASELVYKAISLQPEQPAAYHSLGYILKAFGDRENAIVNFMHAFNIDNTNGDALLQTGNCYLSLGDHAKAAEHYAATIRVEPTSAEAFNNLGTSVQKLGYHDYATAAFYAGHMLMPDEHVTAFNVGISFQLTRRYEEAIAYMKRAIELNPKFVAAYSTLGQVLFKLDIHDESRMWLTRGIKHADPTNAKIYTHLGDTLQRLGFDYFDLAMEMYWLALVFDTDKDTAIWNNIACIRTEEERYRDAVYAFSQALIMNPLPPTDEIHLHAGVEGNRINVEPWFNRLRVKQLIADWESREEEHHIRDLIVDAELRRGKERPTLHPFYALPYRLEYGKLLELSKGYARLNYNRVKRFVPEMRASLIYTQALNANKIRLGYISANFRNHPEADLVQSVFRLHDRNLVEVYGYALTEDPPYFDYWGIEVRQKIVAGMDKFEDITFYQHQDATIKINADKVHILINLNGFLRDSRTEVFVLRPAPIQVLWGVGYPGTLGCTCIDYYLSEAIISPPEYNDIYAEKLVYMPGSYQINSYRERYSWVYDESDEKHHVNVTKKEIGLPEDKVIMHNTCQHYKIEPDIFDRWTNILKRVPNSLLWLLDSPEEGGENLRTEAAKRGINVHEQMHFTDKVPRDDHIRRARLADIYLDTWTVNAHSTGSDILWGGLPMVTLAALEGMQARVGAALVNNLGMPELITRSMQDYEDFIVEMMLHPEKMLAMKRKLDRMRLTTPQFNTAQWVKDWERAAKRMWQVYAVGETPWHMTLRDPAETPHEY